MCPCHQHFVGMEPSWSRTGMGDVTEVSIASLEEFRNQVFQFWGAFWRYIRVPKIKMAPHFEASKNKAQNAISGWFF